MEDMEKRLSEVGTREKELREVDIENNNELLTAINEIIAKNMNTLAMSDKKHRKVDEIRTVINTEWNNYVCSKLLNDILTNNYSFIQDLPKEAKEKYDQLVKDAGKKDSYFRNFKNSIGVQKTGFYSKYVPASHLGIKFVDGKCKLMEKTDRKDSFGIESSLTLGRVNILDNFDKKEIFNIFRNEEIKLLQEEVKKEYASISFSEMYEEIERRQKEDFSISKYISKFNEMEKSYSDNQKKMTELLSVEYAINKYKGMFNSDKTAKLNEVYKGLEVLKEKLRDEKRTIEKSFSNLENKYYDEAYSVEEIVALITLVEKQIDNEGRKLSAEELEELKTRLEKTPTELFKKAASLYDKKEATMLGITITKDVQASKEYYYNEIIAANGNIIDPSSFSRIYDIYTENNTLDSKMLNDIVCSIVAMTKNNKNKLEDVPNEFIREYIQNSIAFYEQAKPKKGR